MSSFLEYIISPYRSYTFFQIILEVIATVFGIVSVFFSKNRNILVYPTGVISTFLYIFLFFNWGLYGETLVSLYYTSMSIYGWILWHKKTKEDNFHIETEWAKTSEYLKALGLFIVTFIFILILYHFRPIIDGVIEFDQLKTLTWNYTIIDFIDASLTGIFLIGMWMMAKGRIDSWYFWIIGDLVMVPLLLYKGYAISSFQYLFLTILAFQGLIEWKRNATRKKSLSS